MDNLVAVVVMGEAYEGYQIKGVYENFNGAIKEAGKLAEAEGMSFVDGSERTLSPSGRVLRLFGILRSSFMKYNSKEG